MTTYWYEGLYPTGTHEPGGSLKYLDEYGVEQWEQFLYSEGGCVSYYSSVPPYAKIDVIACTPPPNQINLSNSTSISNCAGAGVSSYPIVVFSDRNPMQINDIVYSDDTRSSVFIGDNTWYSVSSQRSYRINSSGIVTEIDNSCEPLP